MKKIISLFSLILLLSCVSNKKTISPNSLVEILTEQENGGGNLHFYELISERAEMSMLLNDPNLKRKIKPYDIINFNFVVLSLGKKYSTGNSISISDVKENDKNIEITVLEKETKTTKDSLTNPVYPYAVIKVNSKKTIVFKY